MKKLLAAIIVVIGLLGFAALLLALFIVEPVLMSIFVGLPVFMAIFFWAVNLLYDDWVSKEP